MKFIINFIYQYYENNHNKNNLLHKFHKFIFANRLIASFLFNCKIIKKPDLRGAKIRPKTNEYFFDLTTLLLRGVLNKYFKNNNKRMKILEIGPGWHGILSIFLAKKFDIELHVSEIDETILDSAKKSFLLNNITPSYYLSNVFAGIRTQEFDLIFWNPPYYDKKETFLYPLIDNADKFLKTGGKLIIGYNTTPLNELDMINAIKRNKSLSYSKTIRYRWNNHLVSIISK